ncbi:hypothetical protein H5410_047956 [Solanum commersonii]|uniref:Uncharacterized protein n=1 Tax=Solanum commersonii TaxID=4109 RepID=A0A9J5XIK7_SOLCO|nr:hypothetical protein H5410_047956 [Solanum commersonii]
MEESWWHERTTSFQHLNCQIYGLRKVSCKTSNLEDWKKQLKSGSFVVSYIATTTWQFLQINSIFILNHIFFPSRNLYCAVSIQASSVATNFLENENI